MTAVKICGLSEPKTLDAAVQSGARYVGFVFYPPSPRNVSFDIAWNLARAVPTGVRSVGLFVDPDDALLDRILTGIQLDMIQLSGSETPGRIQEIKERFSTPVIKAVHVAKPEDLDGIEGYEAAADWLLFDTKIAGQHGGTGESFDWDILAGRAFKKPWMLSGGLTPDIVQEALRILKPDAVDVSSGVESSRGVKDAAKIEAFIQKVAKISQN